MKSLILKARSRANRSEEGANPKERHKRKASDVQVASFVSAERSDAKGRL